MKKSLRKTIFILFILSIVLFAISHFKRNALPDVDDIQSSLYLEPKQTETDMKAFTITKEDYTYELTPQFNYELYGLVVEDYDAENFFDITHEHDPMQTKDVCTLWGENLKSDIYQRVNYSHGEWTCYYKTKSNEDYKLFSGDEFANNHLIPSNDEVYKNIKNSQIGDQVYIKGYLVDYAINTPEGKTGTRDTSTVRTDTGCEIIYVTEFRILEKENNVFDTLYTASKYAILVLLVLLIGSVIFI